MNKRILYTLIFTSIFILSTVSLFAQPAAGAQWKLGIPPEAKGMEAESEVKVYDKDEWRDHLGNDFDDKVTERHGGDADEVGARSKTKLNDFEATDVDFFGEIVMETDVPKGEDGKPLTLFETELTDYWSAVDLVEKILEEQTTVSPVLTDSGMIALISNGISTVYGPAFDLTPNNTAHDDTPHMVELRAQNMLWRAGVGILSIKESKELFAKKYKGYEIEIDSWDFVEDGDFDSEPDEDDWIRPIIKDPHDYYEIYYQFVSYVERQLSMADQITADIEDVRTRLIGCREGSMNQTHGDPDADIQYAFWETLNTTLTTILPALLPLPGEPNYALKKQQLNDVFNQSNGDLVALTLDALVNATGENPLQILGDFPAGLKYARPYIMDLVPLQRKEFLALLLKEGVFAMQPVDKYLEKLVDDFNIDKDEVWGDDFTIDRITAKDDLHVGGIEVEGRVVTVEYKWAEDIYDLPVGVDPNPAIHTPRKDYKIIYTYGDTGGQISIEYEGSETFFKIESIAPLIPGYEITILLASAAISALAIIYVVMKKKRM